MTGPAQPTSQQLHSLRVLYRERRYAEACAEASALCARFPRSLTAAILLGAAARGLGQLDKAEAAFRAALGIDPVSSDARYNLALVQADLGDEAGAIASYRTLIAQAPDHVQALNNLAAALTRRGECEEALGLLERALALRPRLALLHHGRGNALRRLGQFGDAVMAYRNALALNPGLVRAQYNIALIEQERGDPERALAGFRSVLEREPGHALARLQMTYLLAQHCDWDALAGHRSEIAGLGVTGAGVPPFGLIALEDHPARQLARAKSWAARQFRRPPASLPVRPKNRPEKLRIGIVSGDFHDHPSMHLMAGLLAQIDRERFELHAFSHGEQREDDYRRKARGLVDRFHDVAGWSDARIVELAQASDLHIAIDRKGYTSGSRIELFEHRLAPVQVHFLAYPGTLGAPFIDYTIADPVVVPDAQRGHISEAIIRLPHCYQPSDRERPIAPLTTTRADHGLPDDALVLACFNATNKITAREFDIWMRVMKAVPGSVLWLFRSNDLAPANLSKQAARRGVAPERLVFADRLPSPEHLARHAHADLFVDTVAFNAHTTASDALWAGLPLVTRAGDQFAARVAASLLNAVGLPELVTTSDAGYEALILALAQDRARLAEVKAKLASNRLTTPLFDTALYTRHFEDGLARAYDRWFAGEEPADITVPDLAGRP